ncbi:uncharacterized protein TNCV_3226081 [Trichonephila clavipes]|nr:uncharacterized protein TNCV_3226081 [Trichonephila clavipes]
MIKENIRDQLRIIYQKYPKLNNKSSGKLIRLLANDDIEYHELTQMLEADKDFEFYVIEPKINKPIKIVIKGLPIFTKTEDIITDLDDLGLFPENVIQLISKKNQG